MQFQTFLDRIGQPPDPLSATLAPLTVEEVVGTYFFTEQDLEPGLVIANERTQFHWEECRTGVGWEVTLFTPAGDAVHNSLRGSLLPIKRQLLTARHLRGRRGKGRVAHNACLCLRSGFVGHGIGRLLYEREARLYARWGAVEIQLEAACEALRTGVWFRFGYRVPPDVLKGYGTIWAEIQRAALGRSEQELRPLGDSWDTWEPRFREWVGGLETLPMYRILG